MLCELGCQIIQMLLIGAFKLAEIIVPIVWNQFDETYIG